MCFITDIPFISVIVNFYFFMPLISIIVPVYNVENYLSHCLDSVLSQTFRDIEVLLIDDGSTDNSGKICDQYASKDTRIRVFHKEKGGVSSARNMGLDMAIGEWITFVDADDWIDINMYEMLYNEALKSQSDIVLCDFYLYYSKNKKTLCSAISTDDTKDNILRNYILSFTALWNMLVHRSLYDKNFLRIPLDLINCEDFWLTVQLCYYASKISSVHVPLYYYNRANVNSILNNFNIYKSESEYRAYLGIISFFKDKNILNLFHREISWRILKCNQDLVLNPKMHKTFLARYPESHKYILSCPENFCNKKIKLLMWLLVHKMRFCVILICKMRSLLGR